MMNIHIKNGRFLDPKNQIDRKQDIYISNGKVISVTTEPVGFAANRVIDAEGLVVSPGLIDLAARLREPGYEYRATLESEMLAAVAGGVTSLCCPPDTDPPLDEPGLVEMLKHRAKSLNQSHVYPLGALTQGLEGQVLTEMAELRDAGCVGFSHANEPLVDTQVLMRAMQYAATFDFTVWLCPQDPFLAKGGVAHDGVVATRLGLQGIPTTAETIAVNTIIELMRVTGAKVHLCRLSSVKSVEMVQAAKKEGLPLTADVGIHHLHLCELDINFFDANCHLRPPLRTVRDRDGLQAALKAGVLDALCSNHTPVDDDAKILPFAQAEPGATGLELLLPLTLDWGQKMGLSLSETLEKLTVGPAKVLGLDIGHLSVGANADICIFDPHAFWTVEPKKLKSQGKNTPFVGMQMEGKVRYTLVDGKIVYASADVA